MKKYYVNGGIEINTPFFKQMGAGAGYEIEMVPGCEVLPTTHKLPTGEDYLLIDEDFPQTMFAEYYAKTFFSTGYCWAPMFHKTYEDDYSEFQARLNDARVLMKLKAQLKGAPAGSCALLSRYAFFTVLSALDTFLADIVLTRITNDETAFYQLARRTKNYRNCEADFEAGKYGVVEQKVIEYVLKQSYLNADSIKETLNMLFGFSVVVDSTLKDLFRQRHRIAHRGGRLRDGSFVEYSPDEINNTIVLIDGFVVKIIEQIRNWESQKNNLEKSSK